MGADDWLLPGVPKTSECVALWHAGYPNYYRRLENLFTQTGEGDEIFLAGWWFEPAVTLGKHTAKDLLASALSRGARVRVLLTAATTPNASNGAAVTLIRGLVGKGGRRGEAHLDDQSMGTTDDIPGTFHQKAVFVRTGKETRFLVGGMDVAPGRITGGESTWPDVQAEIVGRAALLGLFTLEQRWSSVTGGARPASFVPGRENNITFAQFVRTYGKPNSPASTARTYAPNGEFTTHDLLRRACDRAKKFIYIEDQYFVGERAAGANPRLGTSVDQALAAAVARGASLIVVSNRAEYVDATYVPKLRRRELRSLITSGLTDPRRAMFFRVKDAFNPPSDPNHNFVHTKAWIVDDEFAYVGSANYTRMSMTFEGELGVGVASTATDVVARLRRKLWLALLNIPGQTVGFFESDVHDWTTGRDAFLEPTSPLELDPVDTSADSNTRVMDPDGSPPP